jgi:glyoxylase-like metal-dependent hydrolase (beta-lactamase superfamily II)
MKWGSFDIFPVCDGRFRLDGGAMFGVVPKVLWEPCCHADEQNRIQLALNCLVIRAHGQHILIDTGLGGKWQPKFWDMLAMERADSLSDGLRALDLCADNIDVVINTHLHFDHAGGNTEVVEGTVMPKFRKARYLVQRREFDDAAHPNERTKASYRAENLAPVAETRQWEMLDGDTEILPGISVMVTGGHTVGHQAVKIESEGKVAFFPGDLIPTVAHLPLPYIMGYDLFPLHTLEAKRRILSQACEEGWLLFFEHDPGVRFGFVHRDEEGACVLNKGEWS